METGACSCGYDDEGPPVHCFTEQKPKARKEHFCNECHKTIVKGEVYWRCAFVSDGTWYRTTRCRACYQIGIDYCCETLGAGDVWRNIWDVFGLNLRPGEDRVEPENIRYGYGVL